MIEPGRPLAGLLIALALAGCALDTTPSGHANSAPRDAAQAHDDGGGMLLLGDAGRDASTDASLPARDAGPDASMQGRDASTDASAPTRDAGHGASTDAGPPPEAPPLLITHFTGGGLSTSSQYQLRHTLGALRPTHSPTVPTGVSTSENYRLSAGLMSPAR